MAELEEMFRPPINRAMKVLDRSFFKKTIPISAARILDIKNASKLRLDLQKSKDILFVDRLSNIALDPVEEYAKAGKKCILLRPQVTESGLSTPWSPRVAELESENLIKVIPYEVKLDYDFWTYHEIASAVLPIVPDPAAIADPNNPHDSEIPSGFTTVGHVAHFNLRDQYAEHKHLIGAIVLDKNPTIRTVINKIDDVGEASAFRTFRYEVIAGPHDMDVEIKEQTCTFRFNYAEVYWNSRLNTEHERLVTLFPKGTAVCDVMAGIGPFAVPAGKKSVFVYANDLNPASHASLVDAIARNKVQDYVLAFNSDGHDFIRSATSDLLRSKPHSVSVYEKLSRTEEKAKKTPKVLETLVRPRVFDHYVMNLPASAPDFLPDFIGLYTPEDRKLLPEDFKLPMIHCYCFGSKAADNVQEVCREVSRRIGHEITLDTPETEIVHVRDVAPNKLMFCATFRLPEEVAFRARE